MSGTEAIVIGGGIAGVSVAYELARAGCAVHLLEAEETLAFHTTGRSAAQYLENYGNDVVRRLTIASRPFFEGAGARPLWSPRACLQVGRAGLVDDIRAQVLAASELAPSIEFVDGDQARALMPVLRNDVECGMYEPEAMELDVAEIHQTFVNGLRTAGGEIHVDCAVTALERRAGTWRVTVSGGTTMEADIVVNAAGAWGDVLGEMARAQQVGLHPLRRTVAVASLPADVDSSGWPLVGFDADDGLMEGYCKPEPGGLLVSPADETFSPPCDARPEELDVALGLDTLARWTTLEPRHVRATWAGLRSFTADRTPVAGFAPDAPGFFWLVGQGGYGIQMAPGLARAAAGIIIDGEIPDDLRAAGVSASDLSPTRPGLGGELIAGH